MITFESVQEDRERLLPFLLLADESEAIVRAYIDEGEMFAIRQDGVEIGVLQLICEADAAEIKDLALGEGHRLKGIGRRAVAFAADEARRMGARRLIVGTADSSLEAIAFYESTGFVRSGVRADFFDAYPHEIWENGRRARDMVLFEMSL